MNSHKKNPEISVILPVYNAEKYIRNSIESILHQSYKDFELIIINDGPIDNSGAIISSFNDVRIHYYTNDTNLGLIKTLNKSINLSKGRYIARMDADDICMPNRFEKQVAFMESHPSVVLCGTWAKIIDDQGKITGRIKRIDSSDLIRATMLFTTPFLHPSVMMRSDALQNNQYDDISLHCEDLELWMRLAKQPEYQFANLPEFLLHYRWHTTNISVQNSDFQADKKKQLIRPYIENLAGVITDDELKIHFLAFSTKALSISERKQSNIWLANLSQKNKYNKHYHSESLDALFLSRWFITCLRAKAYLSLFCIKLPWYNPTILAKALKLMLYK